MFALAKNKRAFARSAAHLGPVHLGCAERRRPPEGPERTAHAGRTNSTPTHHFRQSWGLTVPAGERFLVLEYLRGSSSVWMRKEYSLN